VTPGRGLYLPTSISYTSTVSDPLAGQALRIRLRTVGGGQTLFDDVRLEATAIDVDPNPVPEPSTLALAGVAALGLVKYRRRRVASGRQ
jgi:hypothetical protein